MEIITRKWLSYIVELVVKKKHNNFMYMYEKLKKAFNMLR
jgi:hypothetical protein